MIKEESGSNTMSTALAMQETFVLLYAVPFFGELPAVAELNAIPPSAAASYLQRLDEIEQRLLGEAYRQARRIRRVAVGRLPLDDPTHSC